MEVHVWDAPIRATWHKSNTLVDLHYAPEALELLIHEEGTKLRWKVVFKDPAGVKVIVGENAHWSQQSLPQDGGFFRITESPWLSALGLTETNDQEQRRHYVVCCRREMIEVAAREVTFATE